MCKKRELFLFYLYSKHREHILSASGKQWRNNYPVQMIDARAAKLSDYSYPITKSSNCTVVIGYPRDRATITWQTGARRASHKPVFCYRYD